MLTRWALAAALLLACVACPSDTTDPTDTTPARIAVLSGDEQSASVGTLLPDPLVIQVTNARGHPLPEILVDWSVAAGDGHVSTASSVTDDEGRAETMYTVGTPVGHSNRVRASVRGTSLSAEFRLTARTLNVDLEVAYISREPRIAAPTSADAPPGAGWPAEGAEVRWVGHVVSHYTSRSVDDVPYVWLEDGTVVDSGSVDLGPGETRVELPWTWTFTRHEIGLALRMPDGVRNDSRDDLAAAIPSDALTIGFRVERGVTDYVREVTGKSFARWAHEQITAWNEILARASHPAITPSTVLDRLRLDRVTVRDSVPLGPAPLPDTDLYWTFFNDFRNPFLHVGATSVDDQTVVLHELMHQRGLIDLYAYRVHHGTENGSFVGIKEGESLVAGTAAMPVFGARVVYGGISDNGLMGSLYHLETTVTEHSVYGLNQTAGRRTPYTQDRFGNLVNGYGNHPYANWIPEETALHLVDPEGRPLANAQVEVFVDQGRGSYQDVYGAEPDLVLQADATGVALLPASVLDGTPTVTEIVKSWTLILRVRSGGLRDYIFLPGYDLNLLYFRGDRSRGDLTLEVVLE